MYRTVIYSGQFSRHNAHRLSSHSQAGATLPELLVAALITALILTAAGFGLIWIFQANQRAAAEQERRSELSRALNFIADEIKEAKRVEIDTSSTYLLRLTKTDTSEVVYYTSPHSSNPRWRGPRIVYRKEVAPTVKPASALVDAIANVNPTCTAISGSSEGTNGFKVFVQDNTYVKLCLVGQVSDSRTLLLETQAFVRGS